MDQFEYVFRKLKDSSHPLAKECAGKIETELIDFSFGITQGGTDLRSLYQLRLKIAEDVNRDRFKAEELTSWSAAMEELTSVGAHELRLSVVATAEKVYFLFIDLVTDTFATAFFLHQKKTPEEMTEYDKSIKERGYTSNRQWYNKGKPVQL